MNRREFTKFSALAVAGRYLPIHAYSGANKPVGYAAVGLGTISDIFMRACASSQTAKITALVTGHPDTKGAKYSAMYDIPKPRSTHTRHLIGSARTRMSMRFT